MTIGEYDGPCRLTVKPAATRTGYVDGAWWPRSRDLSVELPALLTVLTARLGRIEHVGYNLTAWDSTGSTITVDGVVVGLSGAHSQHADTIDVLSADRRVTLLVVPPRASTRAAHQALTTAGQPGNADTIRRLLAPCTVTTRTGGLDNGESAAAVQRWELDGGRVRESR